MPTTKQTLARRINKLETKAVGPVAGIFRVADETKRKAISEAKKLAPEMLKFYKHEEGGNAPEALAYALTRGAKLASLGKILEGAAKKLKGKNLDNEKAAIEMLTAAIVANAAVRMLEDAARGLNRRVDKL
jgi:hypothetical protein